MRLFGLIGYPLGHSFSKQYFTEKFQREGLDDCAFEAFPIPEINQFPGILAAHPNLEGICVTIPYKELVLQYVHELSPAVKAIGASNSIHMVSGKLIAYNTDIVGFEHSFKPLLQPHHQKALILGTGGAAKAVQFVLQQLGIQSVFVTRNASAHKNAIHYGDVDAACLKDHTIVVNCSPVGMFPNEAELPAIPYQHIQATHYLYDLVYQPAKTKFLEEGEKRGASIKNGYDMLLLQAEESWRIWNAAD